MGNSTSASGAVEKVVNERWVLTARPLLKFDPSRDVTKVKEEVDPSTLLAGQVLVRVSSSVESLFVIYFTSTKERERERRERES